MRIAYFSPVAPLRSGIADYSQDLLPALAAHGRIDLFIEDYVPASESLRETVRVRPWQEFEPEHARDPYDAVLYQIGNNPFHVYIYDQALRVPGVVMLHEFNLHYLLAEVTIRRGDWDGYFRELEYNAGPEALVHAGRVRRGETEPEYGRYALNRRLLETSRAAIVHSDYARRLIRDAGFDLPVARVPHGVRAPMADAAAARGRLGLGSQPVIGTFGFLKPYKGIPGTLRALARLRAFPDARLLLVGEEHPHCPVRPLVDELGLADRVHITGFVPIQEFHDYIAACDVCLNLRYPTAGETSGSLLREMALGKPVIVSDTGAFAEIPDDACLKIPAGEPDPAWLAEYLDVLLGSDELREEVGLNAAAWAAEECSWEKAACGYIRFLADTQGVIAEQTAPEPAPAATAATAAEGPVRAAAGVVLAEAKKQAAAGNFLCVPPPSITLDHQEAADYLRSFVAGDAWAEGYVRDHVNRMVRTLEITPPAGGPGSRVLEMGCYLQMTPALRRFLGYQEIRGCYYGPAGVSKIKTVRSASGEEFSCQVDLFDAEKDAFPYPDDWFDTILCCELIEHLYADPMHMMIEINRTAKPGGVLVLTTPNITALRAVEGVLLGYHPGLFHTYVAPKPDGEVDPRHNREFAPRDLRILLHAAGFELSGLETGWYHPDDRAQYAAADWVLEQTAHSREMRGDILYAVGRKTGPVRARYPLELYTAF